MIKIIRIEKGMRFAYRNLNVKTSNRRASHIEGKYIYNDSLSANDIKFQMWLEAKRQETGMIPM